MMGCDGQFLSLFFPVCPSTQDPSTCGIDFHGWIAMSKKNPRFGKDRRISMPIIFWGALSVNLGPGEFFLNRLEAMDMTMLCLGFHVGCRAFPGWRCGQKTMGRYSQYSPLHLGFILGFILGFSGCHGCHVRDEFFCRSGSAAEDLPLHARAIHHQRPGR